MSALSPEKALIFRITHIANVPWILEHGVNSRSSDAHDPQFVEIGNPDLIDKRRHRSVTLQPGGTLSDYVPFYFTPYSPMLYNIKTGWNGITKRPMSDVVILVSSLHRLADHGVSFLFTDRHAYLANATFYQDVAALASLDWKIWLNRDFTRDPNDPDKLARYQAEALAFRHVPVAALESLVCYSEEQAEPLRELMHNSGTALNVTALPGWYV